MTLTPPVTLRVVQQQLEALGRELEQRLAQPDDPMAEVDLEPVTAMTERGEEILRELRIAVDRTVAFFQTGVQ